MEIRTLKSFVSVVEAGSFSAASAIVNLTQSAVSQHIKQLEEEIGTSLLIRTSHSVVLTEAGTIMYEYCKKILKLAAECKEEISALTGCLRGELRIGVGSFIEPYIRKAAIEFMKKFPGVRLNVEFEQSCRLNQMLREHKIDLAFTMNTAYEDEGIESTPAIPFRIYAIMSKGNPMAGKSVMSFKDIRKCDIIMPDVGERVFATIRKYINEDLTKLNVKAIVSSSGAALNVLGDINCITFLPILYIENRPDLTAVPIVGLDKDFVSNAHWMKDTAMKQSAKEFIGIVNRIR